MEEDWKVDTTYPDVVAFKKGRYWLRCWPSNPHWLLYYTSITGEKTFVRQNDRLGKDEENGAKAWANTIICLRKVAMSNRLDQSEAEPEPKVEPNQTWVIRIKNPPQFTHYQLQAPCIREAWFKVRDGGELPPGSFLIWEEPEDLKEVELMEGWAAADYPWPDRLIPFTIPSSDQGDPGPEQYQSGYTDALTDVVDYLTVRGLPEMAQRLFDLLSNEKKRHLSGQLKGIVKEEIGE